jgi:hypothetical protein
MKKNHHLIIGYQICLFLLLNSLVFSANAQQLRPQISAHDASIVSVSSSDSITLDSTLAVTVRAENRSRVVEEAVVSLIDSASGDTIENWYPLIPPESSDSTEMYWNTKGATVGTHTLKAVLLFLQDSSTAASDPKLHVRVRP